MMIDFNVVLERLGGFGTYHVIVTFMMYYYSITYGINTVAEIFLSYRPAHRCNVPPIDDSNLYPGLTEKDILNLTTPIIPNTTIYNTCQRYGYNLTTCYDGYEGCINKSATPIPCDLGYHYDTTEFSQSVITEFNLVCEKASYDPLVGVVYTVGTSIGANIMGALADRFGRKKVLSFSFVVVFGLLLGSTWAQVYWLFAVCRLFVLIFSFGGFFTSFILLIEIVPKKWRSLIGVGFQISHALGCMIVSGLAYAWPNWHKIMFSSAIIFLPFASFLFFFHESPRWLFAKGMNKEGLKVSQKIAKYNARNWNEEEIWIDAEKEKANETDKVESYSILSLFKTKSICILTLKLNFIWFANSVIYYGVSTNAGDLSSNIFLNNTLMGLLEAVSCIVVILFIEKLGRRSMLISMLSLSLVGLVTSVILGQYATNNILRDLTTAFAHIAMAGITGAYAVYCNVTAELYPTVIRGMGLSLSSTFMRAGKFTSPFVMILLAKATWLPYTIFCVLCCLTIIIATTLPETSNIDLMTTIEEADRFYTRKTAKILNEDLTLNSSTCDNTSSTTDGFQNETYSRL